MKKILRENQVSWIGSDLMRFWETMIEDSPVIRPMWESPPGTGTNLTLSPT